MLCLEKLKIYWETVGISGRPWDALAGFATVWCLMEGPSNGAGLLKPSLPMERSLAVLGVEDTADLFDGCDFGFGSAKGVRVSTWITQHFDAGPMRLHNESCPLMVLDGPRTWNRVRLSTSAVRSSRRKFLLSVGRPDNRPSPL